ncbi:d894d148-fdc2-4c93-abec-e2559183732f [Sclerotinia trifoliorum]|uniref:D894d148-fdc2-4c93-abec-e2559183732f n=1 Tax=Sclerotinia trifoliorum TaxID=28548 RepID=A0A8H2VU86_9HELO|nr:d894d148-fdc2-4c93-abec-e2559183732f [Sclerotinia trifoliorum]
MPSTKRNKMISLRRFLLSIGLVWATWFGATSLHQYLDPNTHISEEMREDARWIATSKHFLDRQSCKWLGLCGLAHYHSDPAWKRRLDKDTRDQKAMADDEFDASWVEWDNAYKNAPKMRPDDWYGDDRVLREVPQYVLDHAPLVHLYSGEKFWPADIKDHLQHVTPYENHTSLHMNSSQYTLHNLHLLNEGRRGRVLFMQSKDDVEDRPRWLGSAYNKPIPYEDEIKHQEDWEIVEEEEEKEFIETKEDGQEAWDDASDENRMKIATPLEPSFSAQPRITGQGRRELKKRGDSSGKPNQSGYSPAPATLIIVDKGHGIVDAFWFYFYSYNLGTTVMKMRFGNHVGDWEHSLIRFHNGVPKAVFFSAHFGGLGYHYKAVEKGQGPGREGRPVIYSAVGSHAMYATPGTHPYVLPFKLLADVTDKGPIWDPVLNYRAYFYNTSLTHNVDARFATSNFPVQTMADSFQPAAQNPDAPTGWFWFNGHWGDKFYELSDWRQWRFVGQYHYVNGPLGPKFKNLGRSRVCQSGLKCILVDSLEKGKHRSWVG